MTEATEQKGLLPTLLNEHASILRLPPDSRARSKEAPPPRTPELKLCWGQSRGPAVGSAGQDRGHSGAPRQTAQITLQ